MEIKTDAVSRRCMKYAVIGGGASGTLFVRNLLKAYLEKTIGNIDDIFLIDGNGFNGGLAYQTTSHTHLLNMSVDSMSGIIGDDFHFKNWLSIIKPEVSIG